MNGSASGLTLGLFASSLSASWENFVHGTRWEYWSTFRRKTTPLSLYEMTSPVTDVPSVNGIGVRPDGGHQPAKPETKNCPKNSAHEKLFNKHRRVAKANSARVPKFANQILDDPVCPGRLQLVRRRAVLPDGVTN